MHPPMTVTESLLTAEEQRVTDLVDTLLHDVPPSSTDARTFLGAQFDLGLAWVHFPEGHGGLGLNPKLQSTINERIFAAGGPNPVGRNPIGYGMCGPTVVVWGSEAQKQRYLRPLFTGEEIWCQLFSEPGAGSDFAGLSSRGRPGRRRVDRQRPEGLDDARPPLPLGAPRRAHRRRRRSSTPG